LKEHGRLVLLSAGRDSDQAAQRGRDASNSPQSHWVSCEMESDWKRLLAQQLPFGRPFRKRPSGLHAVLL
jgi:hypothetical protein